MDMAVTVIKQHLIDPEICIRCNTCEATCPVQAITHDSRNYVVDAEKCNLCMACVPPCPTGSIDNWRTVPRVKAYAVDEQRTWDVLPAELSAEELAAAGVSTEATLEAAAEAPAANPGLTASASGETAFNSAQFGATVPPWSAAHAYTNLYGPKAAEKTVTATVTGNVRVTEVGKEYDTHHIVLDFGAMPFPVLEGQSIGIVPPGVDASGRPHHARQYSIASPRNGERPGYNNVSLTIKRVLEDHQGNPVRGVGSNYMCDLQVGDKVQVIGPFGASFLMPNHPKSHVVMICTGTGSAPMRAMTEWRRRLRASGKFESGKLMLFFGARTKEELPYFGPLQSLPKDFIDINLAFSRTAGQPKTYVQDLLRARAADVAPLLADPNAFFYVCGLKAMEEGVVLALRDVAKQAGLDWGHGGRGAQARGPSAPGDVLMGPFASLVVTTRAPGVAQVTMARAAVFNAFDEAMIGEMDAAFATLEADDAVRVIVLAGEGKHFSAGADLQWMQRASTASQEWNLQDARRFAAMLARIEACPKPTVARVQGAALGGGVGLACACDIAVAADNASFSVSEAKFGILPAVIGPYVTNAVGKRQAKRLALTTTRIGAVEALSIGLVQQVVAAEALDAAVDAVVADLLVGGPNAQREIKQLFAQLEVGPITPEVRELTAATIARVRGTDEAREGFAAFLAKRPASWIPPR